MLFRHSLAAYAVILAALCGFLPGADAKCGCLGGSCGSGQWCKDIRGICNDRCTNCPSGYFKSTSGDNTHKTNGCTQKKTCANGVSNEGSTRTDRTCKAAASYKCSQYVFCYNGGTSNPTYSAQWSNCGCSCPSGTSGIHCQIKNKPPSTPPPPTPTKYYQCATYRYCNAGNGACNAQTQMTKWTDCTCGCCAGYQNLVGSGSRASCTKSPAVTYQCSQYITCSSSRGTRHAQTTVSGDKNKCTCTCASGYYNQRGVGNAAICQRRPTGGGSQPSPPSPPSPPYRAPYVPPPPAPPPYYSPCTNTVKYNCLNVHKRESCSYYSAVCGACRAGYVDVKGACLEQCDRAVDLAFLLDASGSISKSNFDLQLEFTRLLADRFKIGTGKYDAQVALGTFATHAKIESRFGAYPSNSLLKGKIGTLKPTNGGTDTRAGIKMMEKDIFETKHKMRSSKLNVARILIVITDGQADESPKTQVKRLKRRDDVIVFAVGVGSYNDFMKDLTLLASEPTSKRLYTIEQFDELASSVHGIAKGVCDVVKSVSPAPPVQIAKCGKPVDLVFVLDESGSIESSCRSRQGPKQCWKDMVEFVRLVVDTFTVGQGTTQARIALVKYGRGASSIFKFRKYSSNSQVERALARLTYGAGSQTNTQTALELVESSVLKESSGMRPEAANVPRVVVVITDGISSPSSQEASEVATRLQADGALIFSVGIQGHSREELIAMSSYPSVMYTRSIDDFVGLSKAVKDVAETVCTAVTQTIANSAGLTTCNRPVDLIIVLDESGSIMSLCQPAGSLQCWEEMVNFVVGVVDTFKVGAGKAEARVGLVSFGGESKVQFTLSTHTTNAAVRKAVEDMVYGKNTWATNTKSGMQAVKEKLFKESAGLRPMDETNEKNENVPRVVVVITDGQSSAGQNGKDFAEELRKAGASIFAIGVKGYNPEELKELASSPSKDFVRQIGDFSGMQLAVKDVAQLVCKTVAHVQANGFDFGDDTTDEEVAPGDRCDNAVDLTFLLDDSGSVTANGNDANWGLMLDFVSKVVAGFTVGTRDDSARVGVATFSASAKTHIKLGEYKSNTELIAQIKKIPNAKGSSTGTKRGLEQAAKVLTTQESAMIGPRDKSKGIPRVIVVLTDGATNPASQDPSSAATALKDSDVIVFAVGVKGYVKAELNEMASTPKSRHVHTIQDFSELITSVKAIRKTICDSVLLTSDIDWCQPEARTAGCKEIPPVDTFATTNTEYTSTYGQTIVVPPPKTKHVCDGAFTGWSVGSALSEWKDVQPAVGRFTNAYFNYDGTHLHILNDWIYNSEKDIEADCYNLFNAYTGNGKEAWIIKVYGDKRVEVTLNGQVVDQGEDTCGAVDMNVSPKSQSQKHTIFELTFKASPGRFAVQLHDPGPRFGCDVLETEVTTFIGYNNPQGGLQMSTSDTSGFTNFMTVWCNAGNNYRQPCKRMPSPFPAALGNPKYLTTYGITVYNEKPKFPHVTDGEFTGWSVGQSLTGEWSGTRPAIGRFTNAYFNFDGDRLHILNDWVFNDNSPVQSNCYNLFNAWTGSGRERWELKVYGDKTVQVKLNNEIVEQSDERVNATGAIGFTFSPRRERSNHSIFELSFAASPGSFGVQLHDPGPRFGCDVLETEVTTFLGTAVVGGGCAVTPSSQSDYDDAVKRLQPPTYWQTTTSTKYVNWCWPGNPKQPCKEIPEPDSTDFINNNYLTFRGTEIINKKPTALHVTDGEFTGWSVGQSLTGEWSGTRPAIGRFTNAYFNFDGDRLHILNDWVYNGVQAVESNCYNLFNAWTGSGRERWELKVYGSGVVSVKLNGKIVLQNDNRVNATGAIGFFTSPVRSQANHSIFEVSFAASPGSFGVQLHDPGPRFGCDVLETEVTTFLGTAVVGGGCAVTPSSKDDYDVAYSNLRPAEWFSTTNYCHAGSKKKDCTEIPAVENFATTNWNYMSYRDIKITNSKPKAPHVTDGEFTGWSVGQSLTGEWAGTRPAIGRFTNAYFNYDGERLHILNDWIYNDVLEVEATCYNLFNAWTGSGRERWELKVYGSGRVSVKLNGKAIMQTNKVANSTGAIGFHASPIRKQSKHSIFELSFKASPGSFGVQLHDPGPRFGCDVLETEVTTFIGNAYEDGTSDVTPSSTADFTTAWNNLPPSDYWLSTATSSTSSTTTVNWCHAGNVQTPCAELPEVLTSSTTNANYLNTYGQAIEVPKPTFQHVTDGKFTAWSYRRATMLGEWRNVRPAIGRFTNAYFNYDGNSLHILNDWIYGDVSEVTSNCYNLFNAWTGSGRERWELKVYGDGRVAVKLNGAAIDQTNEDVRATGAIGFEYSPRYMSKHTIFELSFKASPGSFGVQLHDPGPRFGCEVVETEPTTFIGNCHADGGLSVTPSSTADYTTAWNKLKEPGFFDTTATTTTTSTSITKTTAHTTTTTTTGVTTTQNGCFDYNTEYTQTPFIRGDNVGTPGICQRKCQANNDCRFFVWNTVTRRCSFQTSVGSKVENIRGVSGPRICPGVKDNDCFRLGRDNRAAPTLKRYSNVEDADMCQLLCKRDESKECKHFSYSSQTKFCYLKDTGGPYVALSSHTSGPLTCVGYKEETTPSCQSYTLVPATGEATGAWSYSDCATGQEKTWQGVSGDQKIACSRTTPSKTSGYGSIFPGSSCDSSSSEEESSSGNTDYTCTGDSFTFTDGKVVSTYNHNAAMESSYTTHRKKTSKDACLNWCSSKTTCVGYHYVAPHTFLRSTGNIVTDSTCKLFMKQDNSKWTFGSEYTGSQPKDRVGVRNGCRTGSTGGSSMGGGGSTGGGGSGGNCGGEDERHRRNIDEKPCDKNRQRREGAGNTTATSTATSTPTTTMETTATSTATTTATTMDWNDDDDADVDGADVEDETRKVYADPAECPAVNTSSAVFENLEYDVPEGCKVATGPTAVISLALNVSFESLSPGPFQAKVLKAISNVADVRGGRIEGTYVTAGSFIVSAIVREGGINETTVAEAQTKLKAAIDAGNFTLVEDDGSNTTVEIKQEETVVEVSRDMTTEELADDLEKVEAEEEAAIVTLLAPYVDNWDTNQSYELTPDEEAAKKAAEELAAAIAKAAAERAAAEAAEAAEAAAEADAERQNEIEEHGGSSDGGSGEQESVKEAQQKKGWVVPVAIVAGIVAILIAVLVVRKVNREVGNNSPIDLKDASGVVSSVENPMYDISQAEGGHLEITKGTAELVNPVGASDNAANDAVAPAGLSTVEGVPEVVAEGAVEVAPNNADQATAETVVTETHFGVSVSSEDEACGYMSIAGAADGETQETLKIDGFVDNGVSGIML